MIVYFEVFSFDKCPIFLIIMSEKQWNYEYFNSESYFIIKIITI